MSDPPTTSLSRLDFPCVRDERGILVPVDLAELPFRPARVFVVSDVPAGTTRGRHSHRDQRQVITCVSGHVDLEVRRPGAEPERLALTPGLGMLLEPGVWAAQTYREPGSVLLVLAEGPYEADLVDPEPPDA